MSELRWSDVPGCANLREIGGYPTRSGATLACGRLFRGAELCAIDSAIATYLVEIVGIRRVIDLRMEGEVHDGDITLLPAACERIHLPLFTTVLPHWPN